MVYQQVRALLADMEFLKQYNSDSELSDAEIKDTDGKTTRIRMSENACALEINPI